jgi:hypothetical protein
MDAELVEDEGEEGSDEDAADDGGNTIPSPRPWARGVEEE